MKFTDGFWRLKPGVTAIFAAAAQELTAVEHEGRPALWVYATSRPVNERGNTLNLPAFDVLIHSPRANVIGVKISHFRGGRERYPSFELSGDSDFSPSVATEDSYAELISGNLEARVTRGPKWSLEFFSVEDGRRRPLTSSGFRNLGRLTSADGEHYMRDELKLGVGEVVYGLGERFTAFSKNGQVVDTWNEDGGTASQHAYKSIPFYLTNRGYGVFVNDPRRVSFEVASEKVERVQFSVPGEELEYFVIHGPDQKGVLERYSALTGRPALPPAWSFGLWLSTSFTTDYDEQTVAGFLDGMAERDIPLHVFHYDCFWMRPLHWCDFVWDPEVFPNPEAMLERLHQRGLKACVWINPYIAQRSHLFEEGRENGFLLKRPNGDVWQWDHWQSGMAFVDFTNPAAVRWYQAELAKLIDQGVDSFKTDFGERIPTDVVWFDGSDPQRMHNYYTLLYNRAVFEVLQQKRGVGEACVFARSATVGGQSYPVHWGGDNTASFESMAETLRGGLSAGMSGIAFWSHDIGGFEDTAEPDVYKRWCAFGLLSSHSRLHGAKSYRVPWSFDEESVDVLRHFTKLKYRLMPYLWAAALEARDRGLPLMRSMITEFAGDPACDYLDRQYMLGDSILVAPVMSPDGMVDFYLPQGTWTHLLDGHALEGARWHQEQYDYFSLPLFARPGSLIPWGGDDSRADYDYTRGFSIQAYGLEDGQRETIVLNAPAGAGAKTPPEGGVGVSVGRSGQTLRGLVDTSVGEWKLIAGAQSVAGSTEELTLELAPPR